MSAEAACRSGRRLAEWLAEYWPFFLPAMLLLPGMAGFPFPNPDAPYSDAAITHYPNALFLKQSLLQDGILPLWSPRIFAGFPFIAHPYSGIWYPAAWLALLFPLPLGLNLLVAGHLIVAGAGLYAFLRQSGLSRQPALLGGLAFEAAPKLFAHYGAGHLMLVAAVSLRPWLFWAAGRPATVPSRWAGLLQPGVVLALIFLADPRWAVYAGGAWLLWETAHSHREKLKEQLANSLKQVLLAALLVAPAAWLYGEVALLSTRAALTPYEVLALSLPPATLLGLIIPQWGGFHEWLLYPGVLLLPLAIGSFWQSRPRLRPAFWGALLFLALLISMGSYLPGMKFVASLPGFSQLRVPPRALFLASLALAVLAALGLEFLRSDQFQTKLRALRLILFALLLLPLSLALLALRQGAPWQPALWAAILVGLFWLSLEMFRSGRLPPRLFFLAISGLLLIDLFLINSSLLHFRSTDEVLAQDQALSRYLSAQQGRFRVYSPSYSLAQQSAARHGIELLDGIDPLQLTVFADYLQGASGVSSQGYSVTQPPFANGDPDSANRAYQPDAAALGLLNVAFVLSEFPLGPVQGLEFQKTIDTTFIYRNTQVQPRAWVQGPDGQRREVEEVEWGANHIRLRTIGPGLLVLSEVAYPGWHLRVDGRPASSQTYAGILRAANLAAGEHLVEFRFLPAALIFGMPVSLITLLALFFWPHKNRQKET